MAQPYGDGEGEYFEDSEFLVMCNRMAAVPFCAVMLFYSGGSLTPEAPLWKVAMVSKRVYPGHEHEGLAAYLCLPRAGWLHVHTAGGALQGVQSLKVQPDALRQLGLLRHFQLHLDFDGRPATV